MEEIYSETPIPAVYRHPILDQLLQLAHVVVQHRLQEQSKNCAKSAQLAISLTYHFGNGKDGKWEGYGKELPVSEMERKWVEMRQMGTEDGHLQPKNPRRER